MIVRVHRHIHHDACNDDTDARTCRTSQTKATKSARKARGSLDWPAGARHAASFAVKAIPNLNEMLQRRCPARAAWREVPALR